MVDAMRGIQSWQSLEIELYVGFLMKLFAFLYFASFYQPIYMLRASCFMLEIKIDSLLHSINLSTCSEHLASRWK